MKNAADVMERTALELYPIIQEILQDSKGLGYGDLIERITEDDRLTVKEKVMTAHFIGQW